MMDHVGIFDGNFQMITRFRLTDSTSG